MRRLPVVLAAIGIVAAGAVSAQVAGADFGREQAAVLAGGCFNCHGPEGVAPGPIPAIAGMPADQMIAMLNAFKADQVPDATIMGRIAGGYDEAQILAIARYFSGYWN